MADDPHRATLAALAAKDRLRALTATRGRDFTSNDFLALAQSAALRDAAAAALARGVPVGAGGSRLLRGNHPEHEALEEEAAAFFGSETALYFPTGYAANAAIMATLPREGDLIVHDALIHASIRAGLEPARIAVREAPHNDVEAMEGAITAWRADGGRGRVWIAAETLYSMDGDRAPLAALVALAAKHDAMLVLDEAHATGVHGDQGRGLGAEHEGAPNIISLHTCGKALGAAGALVCLPRLYRDFLVNRGRSFIYSTAPSPLMAAVVRAALTISAGAQQERTQLATLVRHVGGLMQQLGLPFSGSQIVPLVVGEDRRAVALAAALQARGHDVRAIRPPTVPEGTARLRIALTLHVTPADLDILFADLGSGNGARMKFVVSGTDTDIGKTVFCAGLCGFLDLPYWKPVQAGEPGDRETVAELSGAQTWPEAYRLKLPASPHQGAAEEGITIDADALMPPAGPVVIEGAGGLMVPLTPETLFIDVFARWKLPLILCARTRLGTINHTLLSVEALRSRAIPLVGIAFIGDANTESETIICEKAGVKRLGRLPVIEPLTPGRLQAVFAKCFNRDDFA